MPTSSFADLRLIDPLVRAVKAESYTEPTPIQLQAIPYLLDGRDLMGCAQTGSGKTAAFALPILQRLAGEPRPAQPRTPHALVLAPTRELAVQICDSFKAYGRYLRLSCTAVFGGVGQDRQVRDLKRGADILVATPGRLLDLMEQGYVRLNEIKVFVLDEADRMLDMGFIADVRKVLKTLPAKRQTLLFSATMPKEVASLAQSMLTEPVKVAVTSLPATALRIDESVLFVERVGKPSTLSGLLKRPEVSRALIFTRTKHGADRLVRNLGQYQIKASALHGNKSQNERQRTLDSFKAGRIPFLVATDIAARGIDVDAISHIFNFDLPDEPEAYVHRIGRTARAGASGTAISFCSWEEMDKLHSIERLIKRRVPVVDSQLRPATPATSPLAIAAGKPIGNRPRRVFSSAGPRRAGARRRFAW
ncbi:MAG: DEAD/DEAH box helicase [Chloroflexi bacterium]|nr:DEAD/DEAH box helicase [Chloroflexota bacterium]